MEIRYLLRTQGEQASRKQFSASRKEAKYITYHLYVAAALMEYHINNERKVASRIFELCFKSFPNEVGFLLQYMEFLVNIGDGQNLRAIFEKSVASSPDLDTKPLWDLYTEYENNYGKLEDIRPLERRRSMVFPGEGLVASLVDRFTFFDIDPISGKDFGMIHRYPPSHEHHHGTVGSDGGAGPAAAEASAHDYDEEGDHILPKELKNITVASLAPGRMLSKRQLLTSVNPKKYPRPNTGKWESFKPSGQPYAPGDQGTSHFHEPYGDHHRSHGNESMPPLLESRYLHKGDIATYVYEKLGPTTRFEGPRIDTDHIINVMGTLSLPPSAFPTNVLQQALGPLSTSSIPKVPFPPGGDVGAWQQPPTSATSWKDYGGGGASDYYHDRSPYGGHFDTPPPPRSAGSASSYGSGHHRQSHSYGGRVRHSPYDRRGGYGGGGRGGGQRHNTPRAKYGGGGGTGAYRRGAGGSGMGPKNGYRGRYN
ncbi:mRNA 3'-end-processing protein rna14 [Spiromyces aspiralis]|uniref:mRNA 3'-end-processing protein rna14 n=1 Tax=Spiromyces aspiralis TaxID=68401 RepID=A0ACC1HU54_9FUNG|nr:mRNA 3'-end-processing protein rna14 [Spiromyces aspiralis]